MPQEIDKKTFWLSLTAGIFVSMLLAAGMAWSMWTIADENKDSRLILFWLASVMGGIAILFFLFAAVVWNRYTLLILHSALFIVACVCALTTVILLYSENADYIKTVAMYLSGGLGLAVMLMAITAFQFREVSATTSSKKQIEEPADEYRGAPMI